MSRVDGEKNGSGTRSARSARAFVSHFCGDELPGSGRDAVMSAPLKAQPIAH